MFTIFCVFLQFSEWVISHSGTAQPSPQPSRGITSRNSRCSRTFKYCEYLEKSFPHSFLDILNAPLLQEPWRESFQKHRLWGRQPSPLPVIKYDISAFWLVNKHDASNWLLTLTSSAICSAVFPFSSSALRSILLSTSSLAISPNPLAAAQWSGVLLFQSAWKLFKFRSMSSWRCFYQANVGTLLDKSLDCLQLWSKEE